MPQVSMQTVDCILTDGILANPVKKIISWRYAKKQQGKNKYALL